ncbi:unnamed protein product, partial [Rotaria sp. Silwood2]
DIGEKTPQQVVQVKDRIQCALKTNPDQFKIVIRNKSQSRQYLADWWSVFGIPTQTLNEKCYAMKNFIACNHCKTVYRYSPTFTSTNSLSTSELSIKSTKATLTNYSFKYKSNHDSDKSINRKDVDLNIQNFLPSRYTISRNVHSIAEQTRARFKELLSEPLENEALTLSPDLWTDRFRQITYLGVTATLIDSSYKYYTITLCCTEFTEKEKTANNIEKVGIDVHCLDDNNISGLLLDIF